MSDTNTAGHADLMNSVYRGQRHIYDLTRKYYLFGRDRVIANLDCAPGDAVLEIACGTGRNLDRVRAAYPGVRLFGIDISREMLINARRTLGKEAGLAVADATDFDAAAVLGKAQFDRVILSYSLSMIPGWERALNHAATLVAPGGSLHIVDFGTLARMPFPLARLLRSWLSRFHVEPRTDLVANAQQLARARGLQCTVEYGWLSYFTRIALHRPG